MSPATPGRLLAAVHPAGLRARVLTAVLMVAVPVIGLLIYLNLEQRESETRRVSQNTLRLAQLAASNQERLIENAEHLLIAMARRYEVSVGPTRCSETLAVLLDRYEGRYTNLGYADASGDVVCSGVPGPINSVADRTYFVEAMRTRDFVVSEYLMGRRTQAPSIVFAQPSVAPNGAVQGVFYAAMNLHDMNRSFTAGDWADATLTVTDRNNVVVARVPDGEGWLGRSLPPDPVSALLASASSGVADAGEGRDAQIVGFSTVAPARSGLVVRVSVSRSLAVADANRAMVQGLGVLGLVSGLAVFIGVAAADRLILRPLDELERACRRLSSGDLATRAAASTTIPELRELGEAFDDMAASLEQRQIAECKAEHERQLLEEQIRQTQKMEAIGQLAGGVAHDFNNLLTVVIGHADILATELPANSMHRTDVKEISRAAGRAATLTRQLLAFSRRQILSPRAVDLRESVSNTVVMLRRLIGEHIAIAVRQPDDLGHVCADPTQLEQIILNLAINARDAMPDGGTITIVLWNETVNHERSATRPGVPPGAYVVLAVTDTGTGMDDATTQHIFEPFFTTKEVGKGTGLGLATVYGIVQQSGGHVGVRSRPGQGSTFTVYLPRTQAPTSVAVHTSAPPAADAIEPASILVVEDEPGVRVLVERVLGARGHRVVSAATPQEALRAASDDLLFDLIISDVMLPEMSGSALIEQLRPTQPEAHVLYMSGHTDDVVLRYGVHAGKTPFLQKPFSPETLLSKVGEVLRATGVRRVSAPPRVLSARPAPALSR